MHPTSSRQWPIPSTGEPPVAHRLVDLFETSASQIRSPVFDYETLREAYHDLFRWGKEDPAAAADFLNALASNPPGRPSSYLYACAGSLFMGVADALSLTRHLELLAHPPGKRANFCDLEIHFDPHALAEEASPREGFPGIGFQAASLLEVYFKHMFIECWLESGAGFSTDPAQAAAFAPSFLASLEERLFDPKMAYAFSVQHDVPSAKAMLAASSAMADRACLLAACSQTSSMDGERGPRL